MPEKIIRDPVHDVIAFRLERPVDALLFKLLNATEFQRLRRIHQLGLANLAYPGADHSRYSHSLGVMETARKILDQLRRSFTIDEEQETACLVAALLHDLGHGPLSHVFERVSGIHHERITQRIVMDPESDVHQILFQHDKLMPERVVEFFKGEPKRTFFFDILSSQLDADRLDYLLRDNYMTGSRYGDYDLNWLLHALTIDEAGSRLAVNWKGVSAVEAYLQSRHHMYRNVYFHKVVRSAEGMVKLALQRAKRLAVQGRLEGPTRDSSVYKALLGQRFTIEEFRDLDDISVWHCLKLWVNASDPILAGLCRGLLFRGLFKTIDLTKQMDGQQAQAAMTRAMGAIEEAGGEPNYDIFYDEPTDTPYEIYGAAGTGEEIMVVESDGKLSRFADISPMTHSLNRELMFRRIHVKGQWAEIVLGAIGDGVKG
jgi:uncharacterized protein